MPVTRFLVAAALAAFLGAAPLARAQDAPRDDALDELLQKLEGDKAPEKAPADADKGAEKPSGEKEKGERPVAPGTDRPSGEVAPKDQALDSLLEKLGETKDAPEAAGKPSAKPEGMPPAGPKPDGAKADDKLGKEDEDLDEHIAELMGRKKKKKDQDDQQQQEGGPLAETIKKMREVEQRLSKPDTGDETRQKQGQIVKDLDTVLEMARKMAQQGKGKASKKVPGQQQPGDQQSNNPGAQPGGAPRQKAEKPENKRSLANAKDEWGHLPPDLKTEMNNVSNEKPLPKKQDLITRYYLSVAKKSLSREE
jgi:hypothetical protein